MQKKNFWYERSVLVTGATGLVGFWLTKQLVELGAHVVALVRDSDYNSPFFHTHLYRNVSIVNGDLCSSTIERALCEHEVDTLFHLGAQTIVGTAYRNPLETFESNIRGTYLLLEAVRRQSRYIRSVIIASTDKAYGTSSILPYKETTPLVGKYPYDVSKTCTDLIASSYYYTYQLPLNIVRCGNIFGGGDLNWSRIVPGTIRSFLNQERPLVRSDGLFIRDYFYVKDAVNAYLTLSEKSDSVRGEAFNFASGYPMTVLTLIELISTLMGISNLPPLILNNAQAEIKEQYLSYEKAKSLLKWQPQFSLTEALNETVDWYKSYLTEEISICV